jgi:hypothetical protein
MVNYQRMSLIDPDATVTKVRYRAGSRASGDWFASFEWR